MRIIGIRGMSLIISQHRIRQKRKKSVVLLRLANFFIRLFDRPYAKDRCIHGLASKARQSHNYHLLDSWPCLLLKLERACRVVKFAKAPTDAWIAMMYIQPNPLILGKTHQANPFINLLDPFPFPRITPELPKVPVHTYLANSLIKNAIFQKRGKVLLAIAKSNLLQILEMRLGITIRVNQSLSKFRPVSLVVCAVSYSGTLPHLTQTKQLRNIGGLDPIHLRPPFSCFCHILLLYMTSAQSLQYPNYLLLQIILIMLKPKTTLPKLAKPFPRKKSQSINSENQRPLAFNTKGYFDPNEPYDEEYMQLKERVFEKYRNKEAEYVMMDVKSINRAAFIQRGCLLPLKENGEVEEGATSKAGQNLRRLYMLRKERREHIDGEKYYLDTPKINADILQSRVSANSRSFCRNVSSRVSSNTHFKSESEF